jgi:hypothetical protein
MENPNSGNAISNAIAILREEESILTFKLTKIQGRINSVQSAIASMSKLMDSDTESSVVIKSEMLAPEKTESNLGYQGLSFTKALAKFMLTAQSPIGVAEVAKQMKAAGYVFGAKNESAQIYTALNRNKDTLYAKTEDGKKWVVIRQPLA